MLFHIDETVEQLPINTPYLANFTEDIFSARANGRHIIYASPSTLEFLSGQQGLSLRTQRTIAQVANRIKQKKGLLTSLDVHVRVVGATGVLRTILNGSKSIIEISVSNLSRDDFFREPLLVVENESDAEYYNAITSMIQRTYSTSQQLNVQFTVQPGGGSQTPRLYNKLKSQAKTFVLCVVDGDVEYAGGGYGSNVAGPIENSETTSPSPLAQSVLLDCYAVENIIPPSLLHHAHVYKSKSPVKQPWIVTLEGLVREPFWNYIPLKTGHKCSLLRSGCSKGRYWNGYTTKFIRPERACKNWGAWNSCRNDCKFLPSVSRDTLAIVLDYIENDHSNIAALDVITKTLPAPIATLWSAISDKVIAFGCSGERIQNT